MIIEELDRVSYQSHYRDGNILFFEFSGFEIVISFEFEDESLNETFENYMAVSNYLEEFKKSVYSITSIAITHHEYLGNREDIPKYSLPFSISFEMFSVLKMLNKIENCQIYNYGLYTDVPDTFCSTQPNYFYKIELDIDYKMLPEIVFQLENHNIDFTPSEFYWKFYQLNKSYSDESNLLNITTTNTKARRIGYLKLLSQFISEEKKIPLSRINKKFEKFCANESIVNHLNNHINSKGEIKLTKSGISSKPYIVLAEDFDLLSKINNIYSVGKTMKVYNEVNSRFVSDNTDNPFKLSYFDKLFFLEKILEKDFLYTTIILENLFITDALAYEDFKIFFQPKIIDRIDYYLSELHLQDNVKRRIQNVKKRILNWKKPEVYLEHIIMPRLNWLMDLGFVTFLERDRKYSISDLGSNFMTHLCCWYDIESAFLLNPKGYLNRFIQHSVTYANSKELMLDDAKMQSLQSSIDMYINESFEVFKTLAPNRTTLSQAVNYAKYMINLNLGIPVEFQYIVNHLIKNNDKYIFKYQNQYQDGYIQKIKQ